MESIRPPYPPEHSPPQIFWGELAPSDHLVQFYEDDRVFLDTLEGFAAGGLRAGDAVIVIATRAHLDLLEDLLRERGINLADARRTDQYIPLDAHEILSTFIVNGWPDENRFRVMVSDLLARGKKGGRRVRAFGEMVAVLWDAGHKGATVRLEHLWHSYCHSENFSLFCAYPKLGFAQDASEAIKEICDAHNRVISAA